MLKHFFLLLFCFHLHLSAQQESLFVMTIPKSGTFLTAKAINLLTGYPIGGSPMNHNLFNEDFLEKYVGIKTTAHLVACFEPLRTNEAVKKILVIRDLRDISISAVYWLRNNDWYSYTIDHTPFYQAGNFDDQLLYMINIPHEEFSIKSFANRAIAWMNTPGILTIKFEDLIGEKGGGSREKQMETLHKIAAHLDVTVSDEKVEQIANQLWGKGGNFRKGLINQWKTDFTETHKSLFKEIMGEELIQLGYETSLDW